MLFVACWLPSLLLPMVLAVGDVCYVLSDVVGICWCYLQVGLLLFTVYCVLFVVVGSCCCLLLLYCADIDVEGCCCCFFVVVVWLCCLLCDVIVVC